MIRTFFVPLIFSLCLLLAATVAAEAQGTAYKAVPPMLPAVTDYYDVLAEVETTYQTAVYAPKDGVLAEIFAKQGEGVNNNVALARYAPSPDAPHIKDLQNELTEMRRSFAHIQDLRAKDMVSEPYFEEKHKALGVLEAQIRQYDPKRNDAVISAPLRGKVLWRNPGLDSSSVVKAGDKLFEVGEMTVLRLKFRLPVSRQRALASDSDIQIKTAADSAPLAGKITFATPAPDADGDVLFYAQIPYTPALVPGESVNIGIMSPDLPLRFLIPASALTSSGEVMVLPEKTANGTLITQLRPVVTLPYDDVFVEVVSGLRPTEYVVDHPPENPVKGQALEIIFDDAAYARPETTRAALQAKYADMKEKVAQNRPAYIPATTPPPTPGGCGGSHLQVADGGSCVADAPADNAVN